MINDLDFEAHDIKISDILFSNNKFQIPRYQRPYSWTEDQISDLWNDLINSEDSYFLGSFIFNHENENITGFVDIIDGQQRILTITIFMAVIREIAKNFDTELADRVQNQDIAIKDREGKFHYRVSCGESTKEFFEKYIQSNSHSIIESFPSSKEEKTIKANYLYLHDKLENEIKKYETNQQKKDYLERIRKKLSNLVVINIKINNEENAYEIFETTNARGVDLNIADLLKNLIFKNIPKKVEGDYAKEIWQDITNNVQSTGFELNKFIRYYWISKYSFVTEKKLFKAIKREITNWEEFLDSLWTASEWFNLLVKGDINDWKNKNIKHWDRIQQSITAINYMGVSQCLVFFLSVFRNYKELITDPAWIIEIIEKFTFNYSAVCKQPGNRVERIYSRYAKNLQDIIEKNFSEKTRTSKIQTIFNELALELKEERPGIELFIESFQDLKYKNSDVGRSIIKYTLSKINNHWEITKEKKIDFLNVNIEHILPINPDKEWNLTKKDISSYIDVLGNLTLLDKNINSKAGNKTIDKKISDLQISELKINQKLLEFIAQNSNKWNKDVIFQRQKELAQLAYKTIWNY